MGTPVIELNNICRTYMIGGKVPVPALKNTSLKIEAGEFVAITGASGSGKSTLLAILGLLDKADSGAYKLLGRDITGLKDNEYADLRNQFFGFIFQMFNLLPRLNIVDNTLLPFVYAPKTARNGQNKAIELLKKIGLGDRLRHRPNEISGGQQQRVAVARALANDPAVILADEPTGNLDSKSAADIMNLIRQLNTQGKTIIMVTHELSLAEQASRIIKLQDGEIVSDEKKSAPAAAEVKEYQLLKRAKKSFFSLIEIRNYSFEAVQSLAINKLRSFLSILGVLIGVAAVVAMLAVGNGAQQQVQQSLASLGTNLLMVRTNFQSRGIALGEGTVTRFTFDDLNAIKRIDSVKYAVPYAQGRVQAVYQSRNANTSVLGTAPEFQIVRSSRAEVGRFFTDTEVLTRAKVAVLGLVVASELFGNENPLGKQIRLNRIDFSVIGVLESKGVSGFQNNDDRIVIPITTAMYRLIGTDYINYFDVQAQDEGSMTAAQEEISKVILRLHRMTDAQSDQIDIRNMADIQKVAGQAASTFSYLLGAIAAVSLLVGGIGIMNILLVTVMERTHEIGLRKALGAQNLDILIQFMVEAVMICGIGGILGLILGVSVSFVISTLAGWATLVSAGSVTLAFLFSVMVGIFFGLWPAMQAAKLSPMTALRYE
jgi:macrolide transport system ATP-binding/permease protein